MSKPRVTTKGTHEILAHHCLSVLQAADELGNVFEVFHRKGMDPNRFQKWKCRFHTHGFAGLKDLSIDGSSSTIPSDQTSAFEIPGAD